ncbi:MAG: 3-oxoacyl-[acyl-carrier-protein] synthase [Mycobacteriales bacterium]
MNGPDVHILSVGTELPGPPVDNAALARRFGMDTLWEQWIETFIGTRTRHLAVDLNTGELRHSLADMGTTAGRRALRRAGIEPSDVDVMVMGTATPDTLMPATVNVVADRLGINDVPTYQLQSGCCGAVQALDVGRQMLLTGRHRTALVLGGETCAKHFDLTVDLRSLPPSTLVNVILFGDGAGAMVLSVQPRPGSLAIRQVLNRLTGLNRAPGQVVQWFGLADRDSARPAVDEDYKAIEESVPIMAAEILTELLDDVGWKPTDVDYLLPPQLSGRMTERIMRRLDVPDLEEVSCVAETGNTGNALPFLQLERAMSLMATGDRAVGIAVESSKWIKAGFALEKV